MDFSYVDKLLKHFTEIGPCGCALSVSHHGKVIHEQYIGRERLNEETPIQPSTMFRMYSCSKVITITAAMILYERGLLLLDDPVENYLPCYKNALYYDYNGSDFTQVYPSPQKLTIRHLMTMTAGIPYGGANNLTQSNIASIGAAFPPHPMTLQEFVQEKLSKVPLAFIPGSHWNYGYGIDVLGAIIEVISQKTLFEFMKEELFEPLDMPNTVFHLREEHWGRLAGIYTRQSGQLVADTAFDYAMHKDYLFESGGGGLVSTLEDMTHFAAMLSMGGTYQQRKVLSPRTVRLIGSNHLRGVAMEDFQKVQRCVWPNMLGYGYGLGVRVMVDPATGGSNGTVGEFGWSGSAGTWSLIDPENELAIVYLQQLMPASANLQTYCHPRLRNAVYSQLDI